MKLFKMKNTTHHSEGRQPRGIHERKISSLNKVSQSGRSMVEMLGVLAVIGVLSITAISGYRYAMSQHKINEYINAYSFAIPEILAKASTTESEDDGHWRTELTISGYKISAELFDGNAGIKDTYKTDGDFAINGYGHGYIMNPSDCKALAEKLRALPWTGRGPSKAEGLIAQWSINDRHYHIYKTGDISDTCSDANKTGAYYWWAYANCCPSEPFLPWSIMGNIYEYESE